MGKEDPEVPELPPIGSNQGRWRPVRRLSCSCAEWRRVGSEVVFPVDGADRRSGGVDRHGDGFKDSPRAGVSWV